MKKVEPAVFLIGETNIVWPGLLKYLKHLGVPDWLEGNYKKKEDPYSALPRNGVSQAELLIEVMARSCYMSFGTELNANITKVREGNKEYLAHILRVGHGSVLEHSTLNFMFCDVSRVFTHELITHRVGTAKSQESLRFVRLTQLKQWLPTCIVENEEAMEIFSSTFEHLEEIQLKLADVLKVDDVPFNKKKELTSAMRRLAPIGLATNVGWTVNMRTLRHCLEMRTAAGAEQEIRVVFNKVFDIVMYHYPNLFSDYKKNVLSDGTFELITDHKKV